GKTTTLRLIATILKPSSGTATIAGFDLVREPQEVRRKLGFLSADTQLYERLTPREIMSYFGRISGMEEERLKQQIEKLIDLLDMRSFVDVRCAKLSTGMKQKASIARTIVHDPEVVILDEPTTGLDVLAIQAMHDFVKDCKQQQKCVIFSTHTMSEAEKLCDVVGIIHNGKLMSLGSLDELRVETGKESMEDIFLSVVQRENA
ncbi:MAG: ATP-binding cassette domain-containing protein, partial [Cyanobacteria bacterium]|nr:ATP-binding cassette domain-containing protein [Cyanobacteriota bacterium]